MDTDAEAAMRHGFKLLTGVLCLLAATGGAGAAERRLSGEEVIAALSGNTARGLPPGPEYLQFFDPTGATVYSAPGRQPDRGLWRVDGSGDYCSQWRDGAWSCYQVYRDGETLTWVAPESGTRYPATIVPGKATDF
ncbi:MAG: hypothetical protein ACREER_01635 [Alphaproteobacteria bacterium]